MKDVKDQLCIKQKHLGTLELTYDVQYYVYEVFRIQFERQINQIMICVDIGLRDE